MRLTDLAHQELKSFIKEGDRAIDATLGNGHDTLFLANLVGKSGKVWSFDIQPMALEVSEMVLKTKKCLGQCELKLAPHQNMAEHLPSNCYGSISAVLFNLGYLPHGDKSVTTQSNTTCEALSQCIMLLKKEGVISILSYRGHEGGSDEFESVKRWINEQSEALSIIVEKDSYHPESKGPYLWILQKR